MNHRYITLTLLGALFLWAGMVLGISFLEAPLKFTAPNITLALGLGIGRLVLSWLNKFEIGFYMILVAGLFMNRKTLKSTLSVGLLGLILLAQTAWLLPALDVRALVIMAGKIPPPSQLHFIYVTLELVKLGMLLGTAIALYRQQLNYTEQQSCAQLQ